MGLQKSFEAYARFFFYIWLIVLFQPQGPHDAKKLTRDITQRKQYETHAKPRACSQQLSHPDTYKTKLLATKVEATWISIGLNKSRLYFRIKNKMNPCSQDIEKPCGYRVEVPQHCETNLWYYSENKKQTWDKDHANNSVCFLQNATQATTNTYQAYA